VVQSHSDPLVANRVLQELCASRGIAFTAYSSLGTQHGGGGLFNPVLNAPLIRAIAARLGRVPSQVHPVDAAVHSLQR
jgi:diketogulonate reductase-like aldo/keto reductase